MALIKRCLYALDWACGPGKLDCTALLQRQPCYEPNNVMAHGTYAFDTYYHQMGKTSAACDFNGVATITATEPTILFQSRGTWFLHIFRLGKNGTMVNITVPSLNPTSADSSAYNFCRDAFTSILLIIELIIDAVLL